MSPRTHVAQPTNYEGRRCPCESALNSWRTNNSYNLNALVLVEEATLFLSSYVQSFWRNLYWNFWKISTSSHPIPSIIILHMDIHMRYDLIIMRYPICWLLSSTPSLALFTATFSIHPHHVKVWEKNKGTSSRLRNHTRYLGCPWCGDSREGERTPRGLEKERISVASAPNQLAEITIHVSSFMWPVFLLANCLLALDQLTELANFASQTVTTCTIHSITYQGSYMTIASLIRSWMRPWSRNGRNRVMRGYARLTL